MAGSKNLTHLPMSVYISSATKNKHSLVMLYSRGLAMRDRETRDLQGRLLEKESERTEER